MDQQRDALFFRNRRLVEQEARGDAETRITVGMRKNRIADPFVAMLENFPHGEADALKMPRGGMTEMGFGERVANRRGRQTREIHADVTHRIGERIDDHTPDPPGPQDPVEFPRRHTRFVSPDEIQIVSELFGVLLGPVIELVPWVALLRQQRGAGDKPERGARRRDPASADLRLQQRNLRVRTIADFLGRSTHGRLGGLRDPGVVGQRAGDRCRGKPREACNLILGSS